MPQLRRTYVCMWKWRRWHRRDVLCLLTREWCYDVLRYVLSYSRLTIIRIKLTPTVAPTRPCCWTSTEYHFAATILPNSVSPLMLSCYQYTSSFKQNERTCINPGFDFRIDNCGENKVIVDTAELYGHTATVVATSTEPVAVSVIGFPILQAQCILMHEPTPRLSWKTVPSEVI